MALRSHLAPRVSVLGRARCWEACSGFLGFGRSAVKPPARTSPLHNYRRWTGAAAASVGGSGSVEYNVADTLHATARRVLRHGAVAAHQVRTGAGTRGPRPGRSPSSNRVT